MVDGRLPTVGRDGGTAELEMIADPSVAGCGSGDPCTPPAFNADCMPGCTVITCSCTQPDFYWSQTSGIGDPPFAWGVFFRTGAALGSDKADLFSVRAVRGGAQ